MEHRPKDSLAKNFRMKLSSLLWSAVTQYGRIKHRYLLPIYRRLGLYSNQLEADGRTRPSWTLRHAQALVLNQNQDLYRQQLKEVLARVNASKGAVIFLPSVSWGVSNTQRTNHLAREFARQGYVSVFDGSNTLDAVSGFEETETNCFVFRGADNILPLIPNPLLWTLTYNFDRRDIYPARALTVYDWIDDLEVFPFAPTFLEANHRRALQEATLVTSVAQTLHQQLKASRTDALYLPNGVEYAHFAGATSLPNDPQIDRSWLGKKPIAGYYGAIAEWFDYELLGEVARLRPDWNFLLIGPTHDKSFPERGKLILQRSNVRWIGERDYAALPAYLRLFDVALIPFIINNITLATSPLKLYEYFAAGKAVITTAMPECEAFSEVRIVHNAEDFSRALDLAKADGESSEFRERLRYLGRSNSWTERVKLVVEHLELLQQR